MKKFLLALALVAFTATGALAADWTWFGQFNLKGVSHDGFKFLEDTDSNYSGIYQLARIGGRVTLDEKVLVGYRLRLYRGDLDGTTAGATPTGGTASEPGFAVDRSWIEVKPIAALKLTVGAANEGWAYHREFGGGWWGGINSEAGGGGLVRADVDLGTVKPYFAWQIEKSNDKHTLNTETGDANLYVLGANIKSGDLGVYPMLATYRINAADTTLKDNVETLGGYVAVEYLPKEGVQFKGIFTGTQIDTKEAGIDSYTLFGGLVDVAYATSSFKAGVTVAYGGYDKDNKEGFFFGGDWNKTIIVDNGIVDGMGVAGMTAIYPYITFSPVDKLTLGLTGAYYMSNVDGKATNGDYLEQVNVNSDLANGFVSYGGYSLNRYGYAIDEDSSIIEVDFTAKYAFAKGVSTTFGAAYAKFTDIYPTDAVVGSYGKQSPDSLQIYLALDASF
ncbi:hypothetical protein RsTz2092_09700 [Deferribacterales bacterium RsTz2092]|nr:hypothetical protein AGMMS49941_10340 [Deferribacterales bacterium]